MLRRILSIIFAILVVVTASAADNYEVISSAPLNVREAPSPDADVIGTLDSGETVTVSVVNEGWATITYHGRKAYVMVSYLRKVKKTKKTIGYDTDIQGDYKVVSSAPLNIREEPDSDSDIVGTLSPGDKVKVIAGIGDWCCIYHRGREAYVMSRFIKRDNKSTKPAKSEKYVSDETTEKPHAPADPWAERNNGTVEIFYDASSFEYAKLSGKYGVSGTILPWEMAKQTYFGIHFQGVAFNYGLNDFHFDEIRLGPAFAYYFTPKVFVSVPVDVICSVVFTDKPTTGWGMGITPSLYVGKDAGIFFGPSLTWDFNGNANFGFRVGFYY